MALQNEWIAAVCRSEDSVRAYRSAFAALSKRFVGKDALLGLTQSEVMTYLDTMIRRGLSQRTVRLHWMVIRSWMNWTIDQGLRPEIPAWRRYSVRAMRVDELAVTAKRGLAGRRTALTLGEARAARRWLEQEPVAKRAAVYLMMTAGLRCIEIFRSQWQDLIKGKYGRKILTVYGKGGKSRQVVLEPIAVKAMDDLRKQCPQSQEEIFAVSRQTLRRWGKSVWVKVGRGDQGAAHGLRRTAATLLIEHGASMDQAQEFLGHADMKTTARCYVTRRRKFTVTTGIGGRTSVGR